MHIWNRTKIRNIHLTKFHLSFLHSRASPAVAIVTERAHPLEYENGDAKVVHI